MIVRRNSRRLDELGGRHRRNVKPARGRQGVDHARMERDVRGVRRGLSARRTGLVARGCGQPDASIEQPFAVSAFCYRLAIEFQAEGGHVRDCPFWLRRRRLREDTGATTQARTAGTSKANTRAIFISQTTYRFHPARYSRRRNLFASSEFVTRSAAESQSSFLPVNSSRSWTRSVTLPNSTASASGPAKSKFDPAGGPPWQACAHSP